MHIHSSDGSVLQDWSLKHLRVLRDVLEIRRLQILLFENCRDFGGSAGHCQELGVQVFLILGFVIFLLTCHVMLLTQISEEFPAADSTSDCGYIQNSLLVVSFFPSFSNLLVIVENISQAVLKGIFA